MTKDQLDGLELNLTTSNNKFSSFYQSHCTAAPLSQKAYRTCRL